MYFIYLSYKSTSTLLKTWFLFNLTELLILKNTIELDTVDNTIVQV